jgi:hypothetical protein
MPLTPYLFFKKHLYLAKIGALYRYPWYTGVTRTNFVPQISTIVLILFIKVEKFEFLYRKHNGWPFHVTRGPAYTVARRAEVRQKFGPGCPGVIFVCSGQADQIVTR